MFAGLSTLGLMPSSSQLAATGVHQHLVVSSAENNRGVVSYLVSNGGGGLSVTSPPTLQIVGGVAICGREWFQLCWNIYLEHSHISVKELTPIVIVAALWGKRWSGWALLVQSDNIATVTMVNSRTSHNSEAMHLLRCLSFIAAKLQLSFSAVHLPGEQNAVADAPSQNNLPLFYSLCPQAHHTKWRLQQNS